MTFQFNARFRDERGFSRFKRIRAHNLAEANEKAKKKFGTNLAVIVEDPCYGGIGMSSCYSNCWHPY